MPTTALLDEIALDVTHACTTCTRACAGSGAGLASLAGAMTCEEWFDVMDEAVGLGAGRVQLVGDEPMAHPNLDEIIDYALGRQLSVTVYSHLAHIQDDQWSRLRQQGVSLVTSYRADSLDSITRYGSYATTAANIARAVLYGIPVRVGIPDTGGARRVSQAEDELRALRVTDIHTVRANHMDRGVGGDPHRTGGPCAPGRAVVLPSGDVTRCVRPGTIIVAGNLRTIPLRQLIDSPEWATDTESCTACTPEPRSSQSSAPLPPGTVDGPAATTRNTPTET